MEGIDNTASKELIYSLSEPLREQLDGRVQWQWDKYHQALLAEFSVDHEQPVYLTVKQHFPFVWDKRNIRKASDFLVHRAAHFGRLKKTQQLMTMDSDGATELMAAWWPWGHGATISVRLFRANPETFEAPTGLAALMRNWFR